MENFYNTQNGNVKGTSYIPLILKTDVSLGRNSHPKGQTEEARRTTILQPVEQKPHSQKDRQDEKAEDYVPDEGTR